MRFGGVVEFPAAAVEGLGGGARRRGRERPRGARRCGRGRRRGARRRGEVEGGDRLGLSVRSRFVGGGFLSDKVQI